MGISELEKMHQMYALRVAIGCVLGALPTETQTRVKAALNQHVLALEEADQAGLPGAEALAQTMTEEFECLQRAAGLIPTFIKPTEPALSGAAARRGRRKKST